MAKPVGVTQEKDKQVHYSEDRVSVPTAEAAVGQHGKSLLEHSDDKMRQRVVEGYREGLSPEEEADALLIEKVAKATGIPVEKFYQAAEGLRLKGVDASPTEIANEIRVLRGTKAEVQNIFTTRFGEAIASSHDQISKAAEDNGVVATDLGDGRTQYEKRPLVQSTGEDQRGPLHKTGDFIVDAFKNVTLLGSSGAKSEIDEGRIVGRAAGIGDYVRPREDQLGLLAPAIIDSPDARRRVNEYWKANGFPAQDLNDNRFWSAHFAARAMQNPWERRQEEYKDFDIGDKDSRLGVGIPAAGGLVNSTFVGAPGWLAAWGVQSGVVDPSWFTDKNKFGYEQNRYSNMAMSLGELAGFFTRGDQWVAQAFKSTPGLRGSGHTGTSLLERGIKAAGKKLEGSKIPGAATAGKNIGGFFAKVEAGEKKIALAREAAARKGIAGLAGTTAKAAASISHGGIQVRLMNSFDYVAGGVRGTRVANMLTQSVMNWKGKAGTKAAETGMTIVDRIEALAGKEGVDAVTKKLTPAGLLRVEQIVRDSIARSTARTWNAARRSPLGNTVSGEVAANARKSAGEAFVAEVASELKKFMPDLTDDAMETILRGMSDNFDDAVTASRKAQELLANPLAGMMPGRLATKIAGNKVSNTIARIGMDATLEGFSNVVQAMNMQYSKILFDYTLAAQDPESGLNPEEIPKTFFGYNEWAMRTLMQNSFSKERFTQIGGAGEQFLIGAAFGAKGGLGLVPWFNKRHFASMKAGVKMALGRTGRMTEIEEFITFMTQASGKVAERAAKALGVEGDEQILEALKSVRSSMSSHLPMGEKSARKLIDQTRGRLEKLTPKQLAWVSALAREHSKRFINGWSTGIFSKSRLGAAISDADLELLHSGDPASKVVQAAQERIIQAMAQDTEVLVNIMKNIARGALVEDLTRSLLTSGAIFMETGGIHLMRNLAEDGMTPDEVSSVLTHGAFSWMAGANLRYATGVPMSLRDGLIDKDGKPMRKPPRWLRIRHDLNAIQAQLYQNGGDTDSFMAINVPEPDSDHLLTRVALGSVNKLTRELGQQIALSVARGGTQIAKPIGEANLELLPGGFENLAAAKAYETIPYEFEGSDKPKTGMEVTYDELAIAEKVFASLINSGVKMGSEFTLEDGTRPDQREDYMKKIREMPNKGEFLGHVLHGLKKVLADRGLYSPGEKLKIEKIYQAARMELYQTTSKAIAAVQRAGELIAKDGQSVLHMGLPNKLSFFQFEGQDAVNVAIADIFDLLGALPSRISVLDDIPNIAMRVDRSGDYLRKGKMMTEDGKGVEFVQEILDALHADLAEIGIDVSKMRFGDQGSSLKNNLLDALGAVGRHTAAELFHFGTPMGMATKDPSKVLLDRRAIIAAAKASGLFFTGKLGGIAGNDILRPVDDAFLDEMMQGSEIDRIKAIQFRWLYDMLASMDGVHVASVEAVGQNEVINKMSDYDERRLGGTFDLNKLWNGDNSQIPGEGADYNPIYEQSQGSRSGGLFGALMDAGVYVGTRAQAAAILRDIYALKDMNMSESQALARAAIKVYKLSVSDGRLGERLLTVADIIRSDLDPELNEQFGNIGDLAKMSTRTLADLLRRSLGDRFSEVDLANYRTLPILGKGKHQSKLKQFLVDKVVKEMEAAEAEGRDPGVKDTLIKEAIEEYYGFDLDAYTEMGQSLIDAGYYRGWHTDTGKADGTPTALKTNLFKAGGMPILREVLAPLRDVAPERRQRFVDSMTKQIKGSRAYKDDAEVAKRADWFLGQIDYLVRSGSASSMARLRAAIQGIGTIKWVTEDGKRVPKLELRKVTQESLKKAFDRLEKLDLGMGEEANLFRDWVGDVHKNVNYLNNLDLFSHKSSISRGTSILKLFDKMRVGTVGRAALTAEVTEALRAVHRKYDGTGQYGGEAMLNDIIKATASTFMDIGSRQGSPLVQSAVFDTLVGMSRTDHIGLFSQLVNRRAYTVLTRTHAKRIDIADADTPFGGEVGTVDGVIESASATQATPKPVGVTKGNYSGRYDYRSRTMVDEFGDLAEGFLGPDRGNSLELNDHDETTGRSLTYGYTDGTLSALARDFLKFGLSNPSGDGPNVLEMNAVAATYEKGWAMDDSRPLWLMRFGDSKILLIRMAQTKAEMDAFLAQTDALFGNLDGTNLAEFAAQYRGVAARMRQEGHADFRDAIRAGHVTEAEVGNIYTMMIRAVAHGRNRLVDSTGDTKVLKRYTQIASDSYRPIDNAAFSMSVAEAIRRRYMTGNETGLYRDADGSYRIKAAIVHEEEWGRIGAIEGLDGNLNAQPWMLDILTMVEGFDPDQASEMWNRSTRGLDGSQSRRRMHFGAFKGFIHGEMNTRPGENLLTKTLITAMPEQNSRLADRLGVAMIIPMSSTKLGTPKVGSMVRFVGSNGASSTVTFAEAAHMLRRDPGGNVEFMANDPNVLTLSTSDIKFQNMFDPGQTQSIMTGQMTQGWSAAGIQAMLDDADMFPVNSVLSLAAKVAGYRIGDMNLARALFEMKLDDDGGGGFDATHKPEDHLNNTASLLEFAMVGNPYGSPSPIWKGEVEKRLFKVVQDRLYKGYTFHGGTSALRPDYSFSLKSGHMVGGVQMGRTLVNLRQGFMGIQRTRFVEWDYDPATGRHTFRGIRDYTALDSADHAHDTFEYGNADNYASQASPSSTGGQRAVARGQTTINHMGILDKFKRSTRQVERGPNRAAQNHHTVSGFLANVLEDVWAGGLWGSGRNMNATEVAPILELFSPYDRQGNIGTGDLRHIDADRLDKALKIANDGVVEVLSGKSIEDIEGTVRGIVDGLVKLTSTRGGEDLARRFGNELLQAYYAHSRNAGRAAGRNTSNRRWTTPRGSNKQLEMYNEDLMGFFTSLLGYRIAGDRSNPKNPYRGFELNRRYSRPSDPVNDPRGAVRDVVDFDGETPVAWGIIGTAQRSPSARLNDTVAFMMRGFLDPEEGGLAVMNHRDVVEQMEGDYDFDTFKYTWAMPRTALGEAVRLKNIIGPLGDQHGKTKTAFSPLVKSDPWGADNQYLKYIADQATAAAMKGQLISARGALEKMMGGEYSFRYIDNNEEYIIRPVGDLQTSQWDFMDRWQQIYTVTQAVLDTPGSFLSDSKVTVRNSSGVNEEISLDKVNVLDLIFGNMYVKNAMSKNNVRSDQDQPLNEFDRGVLNDVMGLIVNGSALMRDGRDGNKVIARTPSERIRMARNYVDILGNPDARLSGEKLVKYLIHINGGQERGDPRLVSQSTDGTNRGFRFEFKKNRTFIDAVNQWTVEIGDVLNKNASTMGVDPDKEAPKTARRAADDYELLSMLEAIENESSLRQELSRLQGMRAKAGGAGSYYDREIKQLEGILTRAVTWSNDGKFPTIVPGKNGFGQDVLRKLRDSTIAGYAMKTTLANIEDTFDGDQSKQVDNAVARMLGQISAVWGKAMSGKGGDEGIRPEYAQQITNLLVENLMRQIDPDGRHTEDIAARILIPAANAYYYLNGQRTTAYKPVANYLIKAVADYDANVAKSIMDAYTINAMVYSEAFSSGNVIGSQGILKQFQAMTDFDGRIGEQRMMVRHSLQYLPIDNPVFEAARQNMIRRYSTRELNEFEDDIVSVAIGRPVRGANSLLTEAFTNVLNLEDWRGGAVNIWIKVDQGSMLRGMGLESIADLGDSEVTIGADLRDGLITERADVRTIVEERKNVIATKEGTKVEYLDANQRIDATKEAVGSFSRALGAVTRAMTDPSVKAALVFKKGEPDVSIEQKMINSQAQRNREAKSEEQQRTGKNCGTP